MRKPKQQFPPPVNEGEIWVPIKGFEGAYLVSNQYRVYCTRRSRIKAIDKSGGGVGTVSLTLKGFTQRPSISSLIEEHFGLRKKHAPNISVIDVEFFKSIYTEDMRDFVKKFLCKKNIPKMYIEDVMQNVFIRVCFMQQIYSPKKFLVHCCKFEIASFFRKYKQMDDITPLCEKLLSSF